MGSVQYRITEWGADPRPGGKWFSVGVGVDGKSFRVDGEYLEFDPPRLLVHTWMPSFSQFARTVVRWELEPRPLHNLQKRGHQKAGVGTSVRLRHSGFAGNEKAAQDHGEGWKRVLAWMHAFVESGETVDSRK